MPWRANSRASVRWSFRAKHLKKYLLVGKGIRKSRTIPVSLLANTVEAVIGAVYLDAGFETTRALVLEWFESSMRRAVARRDVTNYKAALQHASQQLFRSTPTYQLLEARGPDHKREFRVEAIVEGETYPPGRGSTKKQAEQRAARTALRALKKKHGNQISGSNGA